MTRAALTLVWTLSPTEATVVAAAIAGFAAAFSRVLPAFRSRRAGVGNGDRSFLQSLRTRSLSEIWSRFCQNCRTSKALRSVAQSDNASTRRQLYEALMWQRLILPLPHQPDNLVRDEAGRLRQSARLEFLVFQERDGRKFMAAFTDTVALRNWPVSVPTWIALDTSSLCRCAIGSSVSALKINPDSVDSVELKVEEMQMLADVQSANASS